MSEFDLSKKSNFNLNTSEGVFYEAVMSAVHTKQTSYVDELVSGVSKAIRTEDSGLTALAIEAIVKDLTKENTPTYKVEKIKNLLLDKFFEKSGVENQGWIKKVSDTQNLQEKTALAYLLLEKNAVDLLSGFQMLGLDRIPVEDRLEIIKEVISHTEWGVVGLVVENYEQFGLGDASLDKRLELVTLIIRNRGGGAVAANFEKFGLLHTTPEQRLELVKSIIESGNGRDVVKNFDKFGLEDMKPEQRIELVKLIIERRSRNITVQELTVCVIAENFNKLGLNDATPEQRIELTRSIIGKGLRAVQSVANNFEKFDLGGATLQQRIELVKILIDKHGRAEVAQNFEKFGLGDATTEQRLDLAKATLENGFGFGVAKNFEKFGLGDASLEQRLELVSSIIEEGGAKGVAENINKFIFDDANHQQKIELAKAIILKGGEDTAYALYASQMESNSLQLELIETFQSMLADQIKKIEDDSKINTEAKNKRIEEVKRQLLPFLARTAVQLIPLDETERKALLESGLIQHIMEFRAPSMRDPLIKESIFLVKDDLAAMQNMKEDFEVKAHRPIAYMLASRLHSIGIERKVCMKFYDKVCMQRPFREDRNARVIYAFLLDVLRMEKLSQQEKVSLTKELAKSSDDVSEVSRQLASKKSTNKRELSSRMNYMLIDRPQILSSVLKSFGRDAFFECLESSMDVREYFNTRFSQLFEGTKNLKDLSESYQKTFGKFRDEQALFIYFSRIKGIPEVEKALEEYVVSVLKDDYGGELGLRYRTDNHPHLAKLFQNEKTKRMWLSSAAPKALAKQEELVETDEVIDIKAFFVNKILRDKHIDLDKYPYLRSFLSKDVSFSYEDLNKKIESSTLDPKNKKNLYFQKAIIALCSADDSQRDQAMTNFLKSAEGMNLGELTNDIKDLKAKLHPEKTVPEMTISESDDPCDLLLIGTEIKGSCQRVNGDAYLNKCLVGYLLNGEIRAITVKDRAGRIVARSVMRLLLDGDKPVLLQERLYSNTSSSFVEDALKKWAKDKAEDMGITLVSKEVHHGENEKSYPGKIQYLGGRAPYFYSDAINGAHDGKKMFILPENTFHVLYSP